MNIIESIYQRDLINKFKNNGWNEIERNKNIPKEHLRIFNEKLLKDFLLKKYNNINEDEIISIFNAIENKINSLDWNENNKNGILDIIKNGIKTNYTERNELRPWFLIDFENPINNILSIQEEVWINFNSRMDIVQYINGLPIYIWELKTFKTKENKKENAIRQIQNYTTNERPTIMGFNLGLLVSQTIENTFIGTPSSSREFWFKSTNQKGDVNSLLRYFEIDRIIDNIKWATLFKKNRNDKTKIILRPHQYDAILKINKNLSNKKGGYVWHTQGSGKTITISALIASFAHFNNNVSITTVIDVDRNELVDNIFQTISSFDENNISTRIKKAKSSKDLKQYLENSEYRGVIVTTTQKFKDWNKVLSNREDLLLISDEAHRTHSSGDFWIDESRTYLEKIKLVLPNAIKLGFTGTPLFGIDRSTYKEFGEKIHKYTMKDAEEDKIITPIISSFAEIKLKLNSDSSSLLDVDSRSIKGSEIINESLERNETLTNEIKKSFERNKELHKHNRKKDTYKAMVVTSSIKQGWIVYNMLNKKMPNVNIKFVASPNKETQDKDVFKYLSDKEKQDEWITNFKNCDSNIEIMVVTDKLLTGYDVPNLRIMYIDKEIKEHNLLQTIARVNRKFKMKNNGYIIYFRNIKKELISALETYRTSTGDNSNLIKYTNSSEDLFIEPIENFEKIIPIEEKSENPSLYLNKIAYDIKNLNEVERQKVNSYLDKIYNTSQIVFKIKSKELKYKVELLLLVRRIVNINENESTIFKMTNEQFSKILNSVEIDGELTYSLINKSLDEILDLREVMPEQKMLEEIKKRAISEIKEKSLSRSQEESLIHKLSTIIDNYNNSLFEMKEIINEINELDDLWNGILSNRSKWTDHFIKAFKIVVGEITIDQVKLIDKELSESINYWYESEGSIKNHKSRILNLLTSNSFNIDFNIVDEIINKYIDLSKKEWIHG